ncbi:methyltransferase domain-containing protein [Phenylobacterium sp.]|uniref:methyltransferase domain-containing protein n=1 Tax=Phenylobacterium sp. TaxID=1871053 RepID=UPI002DE3E045|nr:methyltransferase domain-containing protein [Phenylobacterium sp.]
MSQAISPYDDTFYEYQREGALRSARLLLPLVHEVLKVRSVLDVGCGAAAWLRVHQELGVSQVLGLDGDYLDPALLLIAPDGFWPADITQPLALGRRYDLVQCLEVAEHVPPDAGPGLIDNLVGHGDHILFSAAVPGQGGKGHINERPLGYWRDLFAERGYRAFDYLRPRIAREAEIEWWYRYNTLLYVHERATAALPAQVRDAEIAPGSPVPDVSPLPMKVRKLMLRALPAFTVSHLAAMKHRQFVRALARG